MAWIEDLHLCPVATVQHVSRLGLYATHTYSAPRRLIGSGVSGDFQDKSPIFNEDIVERELLVELSVRTDRGQLVGVDVPIVRKPVGMRIGDQMLSGSRGGEVVVQKMRVDLSSVFHAISARAGRVGVYKLSDNERQ